MCVCVCVCVYVYVHACVCACMRVCVYDLCGDCVTKWLKHLTVNRRITGSSPTGYNQRKLVSPHGILRNGDLAYTGDGEDHCLCLI